MARTKTPTSTAAKNNLSPTLKVPCVLQINDNPFGGKSLGITTSIATFLLAMRSPDKESFLGFIIEFPLPPGLNSTGSGQCHHIDFAIQRAVPCKTLKLTVKFPREEIDITYRATSEEENARYPAAKKNMTWVDVVLGKDASVSVEGFGMPYSNPGHPAQDWLRYPASVTVTGGLCLLDIIKQQHFSFIAAQPERTMMAMWSIASLAPTFDYGYGTDQSWDMDSPRFYRDPEMLSRLVYRNGLRVLGQACSKLVQNGAGDIKRCSEHPDVARSVVSIIGLCTGGRETGDVENVSVVQGYHLRELRKMFVLVAGATGNIGQKLIDSLCSRGHRVRGLGRSVAKLSPARQSMLHDFVESKNYYDIPALERACSNVDAVISAYAPTTELQLDGNLLLLRAAERAGVRRFVVATWNHDWSRDPLGLQETYDPYIALHRTVELSCRIKPVYVFTGTLAEAVWVAPGHEYVSGFHSLRELAAIYQQIFGHQVQLIERGTAEELRCTALEARKRSTVQAFYEYIGYFYQLYVIDGTWRIDKTDNEKLDVQPQTMEEFLKETFGVSPST
ncbi:hypothetical protein FANTH_4969 [Fusarium anthophilum]|uniref:NAD(P)-binding domain-containing protein n=1 Tax=Fusarium anthophilum TaxID=48485 RepID=A0A8H4ZPA4_9HYPO|nr:hypothetical protein FANTH_4969 [Fusarium anthophilum]